MKPKREQNIVAAESMDDAEVFIVKKVIRDNAEVIAKVMNSQGIPMNGDTVAAFTEGFHMAVHLFLSGKLEIKIVKSADAVIKTVFGIKD